MLIQGDLDIFSLLELRLKKLLWGDDLKHTKGLYEALATCQSWENYNRSAGAIQAYEDVLRMMEAILQEMNERR